MFKFHVVPTIFWAAFLVLAAQPAQSYSYYKSSYRTWDSRSEKLKNHFVFANKIDENSKINLLGFKSVNGPVPKPKEKYDREKQFGVWVEQKNDNTCLDTRGKVLKRDSLSRVDVSSSCRVTKGEWHDPYTNSYINNAKDIQIDHVVALSNAYKSGAFEWPANKRCLYANYLGNKFHLLSVEGNQNEKKSDSDPSEYMPPNHEFTCEYLKTWLRIKNIWNLRLTSKEVSAILTYVDKEGCDREKFRVSRFEVEGQRRYIQNNLNYCKQ
jgi:hypothetical protein